MSDFILVESPKELNIFVSIMSGCFPYYEGPDRYGRSMMGRQEEEKEEEGQGMVKRKKRRKKLGEGETKRKRPKGSEEFN